MAQSQQEHSKQYNVDEAAYFHAMACETVPGTGVGELEGTGVEVTVGVGVAEATGVGETVAVGLETGVFVGLGVPAKP